MAQPPRPESRIPNLSIEEALQLFLAVTYPQGLPEGIDREAFLAALKKKIAADRPEWAQASAPPNPPPQPAPSGYAQLKAAIAGQAREEPVPQDPGERYFYLRRQEARKNREQRETEAEEDRKRREPAERLIAEKNPPPGTVEVERVLAIRRQLEARLQRALGRLSAPASALGGNTVAPLAPSAAPAPSLGAQAIAAPAFSPASAPEPAISHTSPPHDATALALQAYNEARRAQLPRRDALLSPRRPQRPRDALTTQKNAQKKSRDEGLKLEEPPREARPQLWPEAAPRRSRKLSLE